MVYHIKVHFLMRISNIISNFLHKSRIKSEKSLPILKNEGQSLCQDCVEIGVESGYFVPRKLFFTGYVYRILARGVVEYSYGLAMGKGWDEFIY